MAGWAHTAHKVRFVRVHYPFHPYYGNELEIVRVDKDRMVHVVAPDGAIQGIPRWMTDEAICLRVKESSFPYCSIEALRSLRALLRSLQAAPEAAGSTEANKPSLQKG